jgi:hypothetical protein
VKSQRQVEIPMKAGNSLDGIIAYLTKKHGGNVHERGIVIITSTSARDDREFALKNVADLACDSRFSSKEKGSGQWVCWDFCEMRVRPTHYTISTDFLKSWVVEGSLDGESWVPIDRQKNSRDFVDEGVASFAIAKPREFRFIRLVQTHKTQSGDGWLQLYAVEFFGTLSE